MENNLSYLLLTGEDIRQKRFPLKDSIADNIHIPEIKLTDEGFSKLSKSLDTLERDEAKLYLHLILEVDKEEVLEQLSKAEMDTRMKTILDYLEDLSQVQRDKILDKVQKIYKKKNKDVS